MRILGLEIKKAEHRKQGDVSSTVYAATSDITRQWEFSDDRKTTYDDIDRMVSFDEYASEAVDALTSDILPVRNWYDEEIPAVECEDEHLKGKVQDVLRRGKIKDNLRNDINKLLKHGNRYKEYVLNKNSSTFNRLVDIPQSWSVYRNVDTHGELKGGDPATRQINVCAYDQRDDAGQFLAGYFPYQIVHFKTPPWDKDGYGTPFLQAARQTYLKLQYEIDALVRARIERAYSKLVHEIPVPDNASNEEIKKRLADYIRSITKKDIISIADSVVRHTWSNNPMDVETNFYLPVSEHLKGKVSLLDPSNPQLQNIADIMFLLNKFFARLKVPKARLANEGDVRAKATMYEINTSYAGTVTGFQVDVLLGLYDFVNRTLFLEGVISDITDDLQYKLILPSAFVKDDKSRAEIDRMEAVVGQVLVKAGIMSRDTYRRQYRDMDETESAEEEARVLKEKDLFPQPAGGGLFAGMVKPDEPILKELYQLRKTIGDNGYRNRVLSYRR